MLGCPSDGLQQNEWTNTTWCRVRGNYVVNYGNTNYGQQTFSGVTHGGAPFNARGSARFSDITDGLSTTLFMSEVIAAKGDGWQGPLSEIMLGVGGQAFETWTTPNSTVADNIGRQCPPTTIPQVPCTSPGGSDVSVNRIAARSLHTGGVHSLLGDGTVQFISNNVDLQVWRALSTSRGGEPVDTAFLQ